MYVKMKIERYPSFLSVVRSLPVSLSNTVDVDRRGTYMALAIMCRLSVQQQQQQQQPWYYLHSNIIPIGIIALC